jgi:UDP-glucose 4-epimerase
MARHLVTGAAGFVGSSLVRALCDAGEPVRALDRRSDFSLLADCEGRYERVVADVRDRAACAAACRGVEVVFHQAALVSVPLSIEQPHECDSINAGGTVALLEAAVAAGVRRFVVASSSAVYGDAPGLPKDESMPPAPLSPYAASKLAAEHYLEAFAAFSRLQTVSLRYFNVYGPGQEPEGPYAAAIPRFLWAAVRGERLTVYGDGEATRDFVFVDDVVRANLLAAGAAGPLRGEAINVATGRTATVNAVVARVRAAVGHPLEVVHAEPRSGDILHSVADIRRAGERLGWQPRVAWEAGIVPTLDWLRGLDARRRSASR